MSKLVKRLENGTDFDVCVFLLSSGKYAVTVWDCVNRTHEKQEITDSYSQALLTARKINNSYKIDENTVKLNEDELSYVIAESVKKIVNEGLFDFDMNEKKNSEKKHTKKKQKKHKKSSETDWRNGMTNDKKTRIISVLQQDELDKAPYAYALWPDKDEDSARSYFYKCLNQEPNDDGVPYSFSDKEYNKLYSLLSNMKQI